MRYAKLPRNGGPTPKRQVIANAVSNVGRPRMTVIDFANVKSERIMNRARELMESLSPEDFHTLQNDVLA